MLKSVRHQDTTLATFIYEFINVFELASTQTLTTYKNA